ncbi:uncharacterized protein LOC108664472 [Hyalella azteca]|uniref:Uncharacterized protein LOC108664472 n=1 Tax=Hyalella azteca TaxID=294128 RepID=A0A8B7MZ10_HYAAZ|nr:uncharacterized protein LOC108664472 [Hyalella azteca]
MIAFIEKKMGSILPTEAYADYSWTRCNTSADCTEPYIQCEAEICSCPDGENSSIITGCSPSVWHDVGAATLRFLIVLFIVLLLVLILYIMFSDSCKFFRSRCRCCVTSTRTSIPPTQGREDDSISKASDSPPTYDEVEKFPPCYSEAVKMMCIKVPCDGGESPDTGPTSPTEECVLHM